jgi:hypothetical protein
MSEDEIFELIRSHDVKHDIMQCGGAGHAWTVLGGYELELNGGGTVKLVKLRNPWGSEGYFNGPWCDKCDEWTPEYRQTVNNAIGDAIVQNDGIFFTDIASYKSFYGGTNVSLDSTGWKFDYFTMFDDPQTEIVSSMWCSECTKHRLQVTNEHSAG